MTRKKIMTNVFELKCYESDMGRYNATHIYTVHIVCDSEIQAIRSVLKNNTKTIEVVSVHPCLILNP